MTDAPHDCLARLSALEAVVAALGARMESADASLILARTELREKMHDMNNLHHENQMQAKDFVYRREHDKLDDRLRELERIVADLRARGASNITVTTWILGLAAVIIGALGSAIMVMLRR